MKVIDQSLLAQVQAQAASRPRGRANHNLHPELEDPVQRLLNAMEPGTYVRPHRHLTPPRWELFLALSGSAAVLTFDGQGRVRHRHELAPDGPERGVEIPAGAWHTVVALAPGTVLFEVKQGPYVAPSDKGFAAWAPAEGEAGAAELERWLRHAGPGERWRADDTDR